MIGRAVAQGALIGLAAAVIGTIHALWFPVARFEDTPLPPVPTTGPASANPPATVPSQPSGQAPAPSGTQTSPPTPTKPADTSPVPPATAPAAAAQRNERMITLARVKELMSGALPLQIVDAREPAEFAAGRIPGAINIPPSAFSGSMPDIVAQRLSRDLPMVVYCSGGNCDASKSVAMRLIEFGFAQTYVYEDGFNGWTKAGEAVEK